MSASPKARSPEVEFLAEVANRTGCGLLLDVNNVFVSATNHGMQALSYLETFPLDRVGEIHLGGHHEEADEAGAPLLIDAHGSAVADAVWALYAQVIARTGPLPTLIEWDNDVPDWPTLRAEAARRGANSCRRGAAHRRRESRMIRLIVRAILCASSA